MSTPEAEKPISPATAYLLLYPALCAVARKHGYALALHGSMNRDLDLIAVPWVEEASHPKDLLEAICEEAGLYRLYRRSDDAEPIRTDKPHGRIAFKLFPGGALYIDLSIMPRKPAA